MSKTEGNCVGRRRLEADEGRRHGHGATRPLYEWRRAAGAVPVTRRCALTVLRLVASYI